MNFHLFDSKNEWCYLHRRSLIHFQVIADSEQCKEVPITRSTIRMAKTVTFFNSYSSSRTRRRRSFFTSMYTSLLLFTEGFTYILWMLLDYPLVESTKINSERWKMRAMILVFSSLHNWRFPNSMNCWK